MKKIFILLIVLMMTMVITSCEKNKDYNTRIHGFIYDYTTQEPIAGAEVTIAGKTTLTHSDGDYLISNIHSNTSHHITVKKGNYMEVRDIKYILPNDRYDYYMKKQDDFSASASGNITISSTSPLGSDNESINLHPGFEIKSSSNNSLTSTQNYVDGEIIVRFKPHNETQNLQNSENQSQGNLVPLMSDGLYKIEAPSSMSTKELYDYYKDLDNVESVSFNRTGQLLRLPNDSHIDLQWNLHNINLPLAWNLGTGSKDVKVAILDTGYISHPDINDNIISGYDFVGNNVYDEGDYDNNPYDDDAYYHSEYDNRVSHGTHIAGIIGAKGNNEYGIAGMNWNVKMMPIRIFHVRNSMQEFEEANLINGIYYAIENEADVINLSLAFINNSNDPANYPDIETALEEAYNNDITVIAAAGNDGLNKVYYPASSQYTIAVGASTLDNKRAEYSNYGQSLDLYAPGGSLYEDDIYLDDKNSDNQPDGILSTHNYVNKKEDNYIYMAGTSVAAAQASGVAALLYSHGFNDPDTVRNILKETSIKGVDLGGTAPGDAGLINAHAAVNYDTPTDMKKIKVMAGAEVEDENGNSIFYVMSNVAGVDENGNYELKHIKTDYDLVIFAWLDQDDDNMIDRKEDYLGKYENFDDPVVFNLYQNEHIDDIDFVIKPQQTNSTAEFSDKVYNDILYSPPPDLIKKGDK